MLILPAAPAAAVSGKQDDTIVFFRWRGNQAARSYATPSNPQSTNQQIVRTALAQLSQGWALLSDAERQSWVDYANAYPTKDRFGRDVTPTGLNWYIKANSNRLYQGLSSVDTAPAYGPPAPYTLTSFNISSGGEVSVTVDGTPATGTKLKLLIERPPTVAWTPSIRRSRMALGVNIASYYTVTATSDQTALWALSGTFNTGDFIAAWFIVVDTASGVESIPLLFSGLVPA